MYKNRIILGLVSQSSSFSVWLSLSQFYFKCEQVGIGQFTFKQAASCLARKVSDRENRMQCNVTMINTVLAAINFTQWVACTGNCTAGDSSVEGQFKLSRM